MIPHRSLHFENGWGQSPREFVLTPLDLIPDFIPLLGFADDAVVFGFALNFAKPELEAYRAWKALEKKTVDVE